MEWRRSGYKVGETRKRLKFAWLPMQRSDGFTSWLENVCVVEEYKAGHDPYTCPAFWDVIDVCRVDYEIDGRKSSVPKNFKQPKPVDIPRPPR